MIRPAFARLAIATTALVVAGAFTTATAGIENAGTTAANFLSLGSGTRALGMGGATLGLGDDVGAATWNAAAAGWLAGYQGMVDHATLPGQSNQEWGAVGGLLGTTRWALTGLYQGERSIDGRDAAGAATGSFSASSMAVGVTVARPLGSYMAVGAGTKVVTEKLGATSGSGVTFDGGFMARAGGWGFGLAAQNVGGRMSFGGVTYPFPTSVGAGVAYTHPASGVRVAVDANFPSAYHADVRGGAEWIHRDALALRVGYRKEMAPAGDPLDGPTFGLGARAGSVWFDYGFLPASNGGGQHRMGLRFQRAAAPLGSAAKPEPRPNDFDWARDGTRLGPGKSGGSDKP